LSKPCDFAGHDLYIRDWAPIGGYAFGAADRDRRVSALPDSENAHLLGNGNGDILYHLREGIERFMITDVNNPAGSAQAQSNIAVMFDALVGVDNDQARTNHIPGGNNVLYMDGHVEFMKYPGKFPSSKYLALKNDGGGGDIF